MKYGLARDFNARFNALGYSPFAAAQINRPAYFAPTVIAKPERLSHKKMTPEQRAAKLLAVMPVNGFNCGT